MSLNEYGTGGGIQRVWKERTWEDNWNNVIRRVLFASAELKSEMLIPAAAKDNIKTFITKYFVEDVSTDELVVDEDVRIIWNVEDNPYTRGSKHVHSKHLVMDIYVKRDKLYGVETGVGADGLKVRDVAIAKRIRYLLTREKSVEHISFEFENEYRPMSRAVGYQRLRLAFTYYATY